MENKLVVSESELPGWITPFIKGIIKASIYDLVKETPLDTAILLSQRFNQNILLKREDLQPVFSFKLRGAYNRLLNLTKAQMAKGVIAASAGNHAQGLAMAAAHMGIKSSIFMPITTPEIKVAAVRRMGAKVILVGDTFDDAYTEAKKTEKKEGLVFIHPYDDEHIIAGQGTVAMECIRQCAKPIDAIFIPIGGGGLVAGMSAYIKYLHPEIRVIGVEPEDAACMYEALRADDRVSLSEVGLFADGAAVKQAGELPFKIARHCVDAVIKVSIDEMSAAIKDIYEDTRSISEAAGALAVAGLKRYCESAKKHGQTLIAVNSGANMNFSRLRHISERTELGEGREALLAVTIPEESGSFRRFCNLLGKINISEFNYRYADEKIAKVYVGIEMGKRAVELPALLGVLDNNNYPVVDMTDNELAKIHIRHLVGGHAPQIKDEVFYRFEFPERPGALLAFLESLGKVWNITLFHYRNHGAAFGRVLAGLSVPTAEHHKLDDYFRALKYPFRDETANPAVREFLV